jgi:ribosomal protein L37AE/L43A
VTCALCGKPATAELFFGHARVPVCSKCRDKLMGGAKKNARLR